jgi:hypothetical protein
VQLHHVVALLIDANAVSPAFWALSQDIEFVRISQQIAGG